MSPISSPAPESMIGVSVPVAPPAETTASSAAGPAPLNADWLLAWLGQSELPVEGDASSEEVPADPADTQTPMPWLSLLPSVPAYYDLFSPPATTSTANVDAAPVELVPVAATASEALTVVMRENEPGVATSASDATPTISLPGIDAPVPVATAPQPSLPDSGPTTPTLSRALTADDQARNLQRASDYALPQPAPRADKGELLWTAELVVDGNAPEAVAPTEAAPTLETSEAQQHAKKQSAPPVMSSMEDSGAGSQHRGSEDTAPDGRPDTASTSKQPTPDKATGRADARPAIEEFTRIEEHHPPTEPLAPLAHPGASRPHTSTGDMAAVDAPASVNAAAPVDLDAAKPLRPAQIATLYVDVPQLAADGSTSSMRLAVTQRGDQVNVQLRSWDSGTAPIDPNRMQPLLQSLADQGLSSAQPSLDRPDEVGSNPVETVREKNLAATETASSGNDNSNFQNTDDRQQKNQERQQQQALFLRRQMRSTQSVEFDAQSVLAPAGNQLQQGASR